MNKTYTQEQVDKLLKVEYQLGYEKGREEGFKSASELYEYEGY